MVFRNFNNEHEEDLAAAIIATIDQGEKWIFQGAEDSPEFGGFIDKLFFTDGHTYGTYCACVYKGKLRLQIGFNTDMPLEISNELLLLISKARKNVNSFTSVWYPPSNANLEKLLSTALPWNAQGHKTYELTFVREEAIIDINVPKNIKVIPFEKKYLEAACIILDKSLSHTFDNPNTSIFLNNKHYYLQEWNEKAKNGDCCVMLEDKELVGVYILKDTEIDFIAVSIEKQSKGLGRILLHHAKEHIFNTYKKDPVLYCIDRNPDALRFYLREGMKITGYSGYIFFEAIHTK